MKVKVTIHDLKPYQKEFLFADLEYLKAEMKFEIFENLEKIKNNRMLSLKLLKVINEHNPFGVRVNSIDEILKTSFEILKNINIIEFETKENKNDVMFLLLINDAYFEVIKQVSFGIPTYTKSDFIRKLKKNIKKTYGNDFKIEEIKDENQKSNCL